MVDMTSARFLLSAAATVTLALALTGCTPEGYPEPGAMPTGAPSATPTPSPTDGPGDDPSEEPTDEPSEEPSEEPTDEPGEEPGGASIDRTCDQLLDAQTVYDFNPNFALLDSFTPSSGSPAADARAANGIACRWENATSGDVLDVSVSAPSGNGLAALESAAAQAGTATSAYGDEGWYVQRGAIGSIQVRDGDYWVVVESSYFGEAEDARTMITPVLSALP